MMNPNKIEADDLFYHHNHNHHDHDLLLLQPPPPPPPSIIPNHLAISAPPDPTFSEMSLFRSSSSSSDSSDSSSSDPDDPLPPTPQIPNPNPNSLLSPPLQIPLLPQPYISPDPHISTQFYTFNPESHSLMIRCLLENRLASSDEIRAVTPRQVLKSWRSVWKDRNEDTAYLTAWKRIQDKLNASRDQTGNEFLFFKNNSQQFVPHVNQWHHIVASFHTDGDSKHLALKETVDRIKQVWTVGAKFYGIPESYIRVFVSACAMCSGGDGAAGGKNKRRRFEYTESFDVPAKDVQRRLQELATKHKVVLCIRQKYIRYKPFMAEVKDYACHRAGEPASKKSKVLKREPYASKRCGCGFRIRAIVPIMNYNEKDKTFVYQEEGVAVFKLYAVHSGHEPGPLDGNARIMHRLVGHKGALLIDQDVVYGVTDDGDEGYGLLGKDDGHFHLSVLHQVQELKAELGLLEGRIGKVPCDQLHSVSQELFHIVHKVRSLGEDSSKSVELLSNKQDLDHVLGVDNDLADWGDHHHGRLFRDGKDPELIDDDDDCFEQTLDDVVQWDEMRSEFRCQKDLLSEACKPDKWLKCSEFDEKSILQCEDSKLPKPLTHEESLGTEVVGLDSVHVDSFYSENPKWYDSPCGLVTGADCEDGGFHTSDMM
ncbi:hypothetical protein QQ045_006509 [Rhodiola kirilowii]